MLPSFDADISSEIIDYGVDDSFEIDHKTENSASESATVQDNGAVLLQLSTDPGPSSELNPNSNSSKRKLTVNEKSKV